MSAAVRAGLLLSALCACSVPVATDPGAFSADLAAAHLRKGQTVVLTNGHERESPSSVRVNARIWLVDEKQMTDTAIAMLRRGLEKQAISVARQADKVIVLRVHSPRAVADVLVFFRYWARVTLDAEFGDGTRTTVSGEDERRADEPSLEAAILASIGRLAADERFIAYMNR